MNKNYMKQYYLINKEKLSKYQKEYDKLHKENKLKQQKEWYQKNKNKILEQRKNYYLINKKEITKRNIKNAIKKYSNNIRFRMVSVLRTRVRDALKGINKSESTSKLLGCSIEFLRNHLQSQFTSGMTWKNYGKWHIDHIRPCASFDLNKVSEQRKCFNYTNLQPLWAIDNLIKGAKLMEILK